MPNNCFTATMRQRNKECIAKWTIFALGLTACICSGQETCGSDYYQCPSVGEDQTLKKCIPELWRCDEHRDCPNGEDEDGCDLDLSCDASEFECNNGACLSDLLKCDGFFDCSDHSDEADCDALPGPERFCEGFEYNCGSPPWCIDKDQVCDDFQHCSDGSDEKDCTADCHGDQFLCETGNHCLDRHYVCNNITDCEDGADEENCDTQHVHCHGQFECANHECVDWTDVCDGRMHCSDGSDERNNCSQACGRTCRHCSSSAQGVDCVCEDGFKSVLINGTYQCQVIQCGDVSLEVPYCSQRCTNTEKSIICGCEPGFKLNQDKRTCSSIDEKPFLIFQTISELRRITLKLGKLHEEVLLSTRPTTDKVMAADVAEKSLFWFGDEQGVNIQRMYLESHEEQSVVSYGLKLPWALAYDHIRKNVYVTDSFIPAILACGNLDQDVTCTTVFNASVLTYPELLTINLKDSLLYWTDRSVESNSPAIKCGSMDGSSSEVFVHTLSDPTALVYDPLAQLLFWAMEDYQLIQSIRTDRQNKTQTLVFDIPTQAITVFEDRLYIADIHHERLVSVNKFTGQDERVLVPHVSYLFSMVVVYKADYPIQANDPCNKCDGMCLHGQNDVKCVCRLGMALSDNRCLMLGPEEQPASLLLVNGTSILKTRITPSLASSTETLSVEAVQSLTYLPESQSMLVAGPVEGGKFAIRKVSQKSGSQSWFPPLDKLMKGSWFYQKSKPFDDQSIEPIVTDLEVVQSLAMDEVSKLIYWVGKDSIEVCSPSGLHRKKLKLSGLAQTFQHPRALALDLLHGMLLFSNLGESPSIVVCSMFGEDCMNLVSEGLQEPNHLAVHDHHLFWSDHRHHSISSWSKETGEVYLIVHTENPPLQFAMAGDELFWVEENSPKVHHITYGRRDDMLELPMTLEPSQFVAIASTAPIPHSNAVSRMCGPKNGGCQQLCFPHPTGVHCDCGDRFNRTEDGRCTEEHEAVESEECPNLYQCANSNECVHREWLCDGEPDCPFEDDELLLHCERECPDTDGMFCDSHCIRGSDICDGYPHCSDGSDEEGCPPTTCEAGSHLCDNNRCVYYGWVCDGDPECTDGTDEMRCAACSADEYHCPDRCIKLSQRCDGAYDCKAWEDEKNCPTKDPVSLNCSEEMFECQTHDHCVPASSVCDSSKDCPDGSDEEPLLCDSTQDKKECAEWNGGCSQRCYDTQMGSLCSCEPGYALTGDDRSCYATEGERRVVYLISHEDIYRKGQGSKDLVHHLQKPNLWPRLAVNAHSKEVFWLKQEPVVDYLHRSIDEKHAFNPIYKRDNHHRPMPGDQDHAHHTMPERDYGKTSICKLREGQDDEPDCLIEGLAHLNGFAVDWITGNIYITQDRSVVVYDKLARYSAELHQAEGPLGDIVVHPPGGRLFWSVWPKGYPQIMTSLMNGMDPRPMAAFDGRAHRETNPDFMFKGRQSDTVGLSLDPATERLFVKVWGEPQLYSMHISDSQSRVQVLEPELHNLFRLDVFESLAYMVGGQNLMQVQTYPSSANQTHAVQGQWNVTHAADVKVMHRLKQPWRRNRCEDIQCQYLCVIMPLGLATCVCPRGIKIQTHNPTCQGPKVSPTSAPQPTKDNRPAKPNPLVKPIRPTKPSRPTKPTPATWTVQPPTKPSRRTPPSRPTKPRRPNQPRRPAKPRRPSDSNPPPKATTVNPPAAPAPLDSNTTTVQCPLPCGNGGKCLSNGTSTYCRCAAGYTGPQCQKAPAQRRSKSGTPIGTVVGIVLALIATGMLVAVGVCHYRRKRNSTSLMKAIKYQNASLTKQQASQAEDRDDDLVPEISFGNPGFQGGEREEPAPKDWWKRLLNRSRCSMDSSYVSQRSSDDSEEAETTNPIHKDPNDNYFDSKDVTRLLR